MGKCVYCKSNIRDDRALDVCDNCGVKVWGGRMFSTILKNMEDARSKDDLCDKNLDPKKIY